MVVPVTINGTRIISNSDLIIVNINKIFKKIQSTWIVFKIDTTWKNGVSYTCFSIILEIAKEIIYFQLINKNVLDACL